MLCINDRELRYLVYCLRRCQAEIPGSLTTVPVLANYVEDGEQLSATEVDTLCDRINFGDPDGYTCRNDH